MKKLLILFLFPVFLFAQEPIKSPVWRAGAPPAIPPVGFGINVLWQDTLQGLTYQKAQRPARFVLSAFQFDKKEPGEVDTVYIVQYDTVEVIKRDTVLIIKTDTVIIQKGGTDTVYVSPVQVKSLIDLLRANHNGIVYVESFLLGGKTGGGLFALTTEPADTITVYTGLAGKKWKRIGFKCTPENFGGGDGDKPVPSEFASLYPKLAGVTNSDRADFAAIMTGRIAASQYNIPLYSETRATYYINRVTVLPRPKIQGPVVENWNGARITKAALFTGKNRLIESFPCTSKVDCESNSTRYAYVPKELTVDGKGSGTGIYLEGLMHNEIQNNVFVSLDTGFCGAFTMATRIINNEFRQCRWGYVLKNSTATGCGFNSCGSNTCYAQGNRHTSGPNAETCITVINSADFDARNHCFDIIKNAATNEPYKFKRGYFFDSLSGTTTVKEFDAENDSIAVAGASAGDHVENPFTEAFYDVNAITGSYITISGAWVQYPMKFIRFKVYSGYATLHWKNQSYIPSGTTLESIGAGANWTIENVFGKDPARDPAWVGTSGGR